MSDFSMVPASYQFASGNLTQEQTIDLLRELMIQSQGAIIQSAVYAEILFFLIGIGFGIGISYAYFRMWKKYEHDPLVAGGE